MPSSARCRPPQSGPGCPRLTSGQRCCHPAKTAIRRRCFAPIWRRSHCRSSAGSSNAGNSRSPSVRSATTSAWRPSGSGRTRRSPAPRLACLGCSPSSLCWELASTVRPGSRFGQCPVPQKATDLRRYPRRNTTRDLEQARFHRVPASSRYRETPASPPRGHRLRPLPHRMNGQTRAKGRAEMIAGWPADCAGYLGPDLHPHASPYIGLISASDTKLTLD
jgi:hypothetical protein